MNFEAFRPFVTPHVRHLPDVTIEHHVRQAAIALCARTHVWNIELVTRTQVGIDQVALPIDGDTQLAKLLSVFVDGQEYAVDTTRTGRQAVRRQTSHGRAFVSGRDTIQITPAPDRADLVIVVEAVLKPTIDCTEIPDELDEWTDDIASGALSTLLLLKGEDQDPQMAGYHLGRFERRVSVLGHRVTKGFSGARNSRGADNFR